MVIYSFLAPQNGLSKPQITALAGLVLTVGIALVLLRPKQDVPTLADPEVQLRLSADPFPGSP